MNEESKKFMKHYKSLPRKKRTNTVCGLLEFLYISQKIEHPKLSKDKFREKIGDVLIAVIDETERKARWEKIKKESPYWREKVEKVEQMERDEAKLAI